MLRIRYCEESLVNPIDKGEIKCPVHLYSGQEAIATGICTHLTKEDYIFGNHRSHGHYLAKGGSMKEMVAEIYGMETGCSKGRGGSMHLISPENGVIGIVPIVAGTISLATGSALSAKILNNGRIAVSFFGDGSTGEGVLYEAMNFASIQKLPIIFVCENNLYSTHLPIDEIRVNRDIYKIAEPLGIPSFCADGNNVQEVYETAEKAVQMVRNNQGPVFIEFKTYRLRGHVGPDDNVQGTHTDIRPKAEFEAWKKKDPIIQLENYLLKNSISTSQEIAQIKNNVENEVSEALSFTLNSKKPKAEDLLTYVYK
jgi:pyruvate dehydrogenase E1 component alpha subunit